MTEVGGFHWALDRHEGSTRRFDITLDDRVRMAAKLQQWPQEDVQVIVVKGVMFRRQG